MSIRVVSGKLTRRGLLLAPVFAMMPAPALARRRRGLRWPRLHSGEGGYSTTTGLLVAAGAVAAVILLSFLLPPKDQATQRRGRYRRPPRWRRRS
jgi:hypothetical protein